MFVLFNSHLCVELETCGVLTLRSVSKATGYGPDDCVSILHNLHLVPPVILLNM